MIKQIKLFIIVALIFIISTCSATTEVKDGDFCLTAKDSEVKQALVIAKNNKGNGDASSHGPNLHSLIEKLSGKLEKLSKTLNDEEHMNEISSSKDKQSMLYVNFM